MPMPTPTLSLTILDRLDAHWTSIGNVTVATASKQIWLDLGVDTDILGGRFGWCWPAPYAAEDHPDNDVIVGYCPELIAEIIAHLDEEDRGEYLDAVEWLCDMFVTDMATRYEDETFRDELFAQLAGNFPSTARLVEEVEARAIAVGIVPAEPGGPVTSDKLCSACGYFSPQAAEQCGLCQAAF